MPTALFTTLNKKRLCIHFIFNCFTNYLLTTSCSSLCNYLYNYLYSYLRNYLYSYLRNYLYSYLRNYLYSYLCKKLFRFKLNNLFQFYWNGLKSPAPSLTITTSSSDKSITVVGDSPRYPPLRIKST